nr:MAG TPA: hypothetical protein [Caudoviricetes sp.]
MVTRSFGCCQFEKEEHKLYLFFICQQSGALSDLPI